MSTFKGFTSVQLQRPQQSAFDLTHDKRLTTSMGNLTPIFIQECIPTDRWKNDSQLLIRLAPLLAPLYDQLHAFVHFFFVANRLLWDGGPGDSWEDFITGGRLGVGVDPVTAPIPPYMDMEDALGSTATMAKGTLADYLGIPDLLNAAIFPEAYVPSSFAGKKMDVLAFAAYYKTWYDFYRDRNYVADNEILPLAGGEVTDSGDREALLTLRIRDYQKDYFTSALPFTQRGEEVLMPLEGTGSVTYLAQSLVKPAAGGNLAADAYLGGLSGTDDLIASTETTTPPTAGGAARIENIDEVLLSSSNVSINDFRTAYALQVWLERNAVAGSRYTESIEAHFGLKSQDSRLQRAEYIGGGRFPIKFSEVVNTAWSTVDAVDYPAGNLSGHGVGFGHVNQFRYFCPEHGFIIGILSIMAPATYQQGLPRMFYARRSFLGYPWPTFAKLGEQQVDDVEMYVTPASLTEDANGELPNFGYQSRYADWKYVPNTLHGDFKDDLLFWTFARVFDVGGPSLGSLFVNFDPTVAERVFAVPSNPAQFWIYLHNTCEVKRALPYFGMPNTLGFS